MQLNQAFFVCFEAFFPEIDKKLLFKVWKKLRITQKVSFSQRVRKGDKYYRKQFCSSQCYIQLNYAFLVFWSILSGIFFIWLKWIFLVKHVKWTNNTGKCFPPQNRLHTAKLIFSCVFKYFRWIFSKNFSIGLKLSTSERSSKNHPKSYIFSMSLKWGKSWGFFELMEMTFFGQTC